MGGALELPLKFVAIEEVFLTALVFLDFVVEFGDFDVGEVVEEDVFVESRTHHDEFDVGSIAHVGEECLECYETEV